ncbi:DUF302 domain-containing protein [Neolewinella aurantiaca]|uniref:DUF302 domain-containing protein n=1 Tax=Neolewinella aurantiaca TaxID=2602767 RepID=A0A5C7FPC1_9BACT|nr:DUF302 domain-containing protein [Neolewinella aurantiaca]TXF89538.1 DUF302 domain-containing protein [Neolewinella aurantiaca]
MHFSKLLLLSFLALSVFACNDDDDVIDFVTGEEPVDATGLTYVEDEDESLSDIYNNVKADIEAAGPVSIIAEVDHASNASGAGLTLRPTRVIMFGNPALGTPLMQQNMLAGLDLPQKIAFYQAGDDDVIVAYNSTEYLASRYDLTDNGELTNIGNALQSFVEENTGEQVSNSIDVTVSENTGIVMTTSTDSVEVVYNRLQAAIASNANLTIVAELDHSDNAASVGLSLPASKLIIFGNPAVGTPFMQEDQTASIDLPVKILVYDNGNGTTLAYNDPEWIADRHDIGDDLEAISTMRTALEGLVDSATNN